MPLAYVKYRGYNNDFETAPVEELLDMAEKDPAFPHPYPFLVSMLVDNREKPKIPSNNLSASRLLGKGCLRCDILEKNVDYTESIDAMWARFRGEAYHSVAEKFKAAHQYAEYQMWAKLPNGETITGRPDLIDKHAIIDLKTTKNIPKWDMVWNDHAMQLNIYRWLCNHAFEAWKPGSAPADDEVFVKLMNSREFKSLVVWYVDDNGYKPLEVRKTIQVETKPGAKNPFKSVKVPALMSDDEVENMLVRNAEEILLAFAEYETTSKLPRFPDGFDPMPQSFWKHRFSPVADLCIKEHYESSR